MAAAEGADRTKLDNWYDAAQGLQEVTERDLTKFADLAATYWAVPSLRQCGKQIHSQGYQNNQLVAVLTDKDLEAIGILPGHAKLLAQHLGGIKPEPPPAPAPSNIQVTAVMDPAADARSQAASDATVEALRKLHGKGIKVGKLNQAIKERPTVSSVMEWADEHVEQSSLYTDVTTAL